jgi:hypothetical protein
MANGLDTPSKRDSSPLYPKSRQAKRWCYACVIAGHEWSITCDTCGKKGTPTLLRDKHGWACHANMYQVEWLKLHCASKMWDMASEETVTSFLRWAIQANCTQLHEKCMSLLERIFPYEILTYDWAVVCTDHPEFMRSIRRKLPERLYQGPL